MTRSRTRDAAPPCRCSACRPAAGALGTSSPAPHGTRGVARGRSRARQRHGRGPGIAPGRRWTHARPGPCRWSGAPCREPLARGVELLACGAPPDAGHAVPLWGPEKRASPQGDAPRRARVHTAAPAPLGGLWGPLGGGLAPALGPHAPQPCGVLLPAEGPHPVSRSAAPPCCSPPTWLHSSFCRTSWPGQSAERHGRGRARPSPRGASPSRDGRPDPPCPPYRPSAMGAAGGAGPVGEAPRAPGPRATRSSIGSTKPWRAASPGTHPGHQCAQGGRGPPPPPRVRRASRHDTPDSPARRGPRTRFAPASGPRVSSRTGMPRGRAVPWACGMAQRRPLAPGARWPGGLTAEASAVPWSPPLAAACCRSCQPATPARSRQAAGQSATPVALVGVCCVGAAPQAGGRLVRRSTRVRRPGPGRASVRPSRPSPWGLAPPRRPRRATTPPPPAVGLPWDRTPPPAWAWATAVRQAPAWGRVRVPLPCRRSCRPSTDVCPGRNGGGRPRASPLACPGRRTSPSAPSRRVRGAFGSVQDLGLRPSLGAAGPALEGRGPPGGLQKTLSTLRPSVQRACPHDSAMDARRATGGGDPLPDRDLHPARDAELILARQRYASGAAESGSEVRASAASCRLHAIVRPSNRAGSV